MDQTRDEGYNQVGDYLYSQDLCVGVYDGTDFNSATCIRDRVESPDKGFSPESMILRNNTVEPSSEALSSVRANLTSITQAQCVMTATNATACWIWDNEMSDCLGRFFYDQQSLVGSDECRRTEPVSSRYVKYVRLESFEAPSSATSLKAVMIASVAIMSLLI